MPKMNTTIELGDTVQDTESGITGMAIARERKEPDDLITIKDIEAGLVIKMLTCPESNLKKIRGRENEQQIGRQRHYL